MPSPVEITVWHSHPWRYNGINGSREVYGQLLEGQTNISHFRRNFLEDDAGSQEVFQTAREGKIALVIFIHLATGP